MQLVVRWMERHQVWLYLIGLGLGAVVGLTTPAVAPVAETLILPVLALLLYATFLGIPFHKMRTAVKDWKFITAVLVLNFLLVPVVVLFLSRLVAHDNVLLIGVLFVLLTPCIDYVIVFAGLAGGDSQRLLVVAPVLMVVQMVLLPVYLWLFVGAEFTNSVEFMPFVEALIWIILVPLVLAAVTQLAAQRWRWAQMIDDTAAGLMVPLMVATLGVVVASQVAGVGSQLADLFAVVPVYILFAIIMVPIGMLVGRVATLDIPQQRSLVFSGVTRNSLVVLPLVLALPAEYSLAPLVVVTQTLVELLTMVVFLRLIPRVIRPRSTAA